MEHKMLWGTLAVGVAGWVCLLLLTALKGNSPDTSPLPQAKTPSSFVWLSLALPILVWLATLPTHPPFSAGQGWGRGFLLGGLVSFISSFVALHLDYSRDSGRRLALTSLFASLFVVCVPLLWMRSAVIEALLGASLGWCVISLVWLCGSHQQKSAAFTASSSLALLNGAAFVTALCSVAALGVYRDFIVPDIARGTHPAVALVVAASIALALLFGVLLNEAQTSASASSTRFSQIITALLCLVVPLGLGFVLATRVLDDIKVVYCLGIGGILGVLSWLLRWDTSGQDVGVQRQTTTIPPVAVIVTLCAFMLAYSFLQGFGVGLMLIAAWPASLLLWPSSTQDAESPLQIDVPQTVSLLATFLAVLLVSRVFATRFRADLRGINMVDQFALFGFLAGALAPTWLASLWFNGRNTDSHSVVSLLRLVGVGILTLLLPSAMLAIWGIKVVPAFFAGMALTLAGWGASATPSAIALFALPLSLVITQWTIRFLPLAEASRSQRLHFLLWGLGGSVILVVLVDLSARLIARLQASSIKHSQGVSQ